MGLGLYIHLRGVLGPDDRRVVQPFSHDPGLGSPGPPDTSLNPKRQTQNIESDPVPTRPVVPLRK